MQVFLDVDGSLFNYKQVQANVLGTLMDQMLFKSPHNAINRTANKDRQWHGEIESAVYTEGTINLPGDTDKYWSIEMAITFESLYQNSNLKKRRKPLDNEVWFTQFARAEYYLDVSRGKYKKSPQGVEDWWSWQPCDAVNLHIQDRWGLVQFKRDMSDKKFTFPRWHMYKALFESLDALKKYVAVNSKLTHRFEELDLPPYLMTGACVDLLTIVKLYNKFDQFKIKVKSKVISGLEAEIRSDRKVTFKK